MTRLEELFLESAQNSVREDHQLTITRWQNLAVDSASRGNKVAEATFLAYAEALLAFEFPWEKVIAPDA